MLCRTFELIPIKIGFFRNFLICFKLGQNPVLYIVQDILPKMARKNSLFLLHFLMHIHYALEKIIKMKNSLLAIFDKIPCTIVQGLWPNF